MNIEETFREKGIYRVSDISEILSGPLFILDTIAGEGIMRNDGIPAYPVMRKADLRHNLLNLFGTHWRYIIDPSDWREVRWQEGDTHNVFQDIQNNTKQQRHARYAFTQNYLSRFKSLWIFGEGTSGWEYHQDVLVPRLKLDIKEYRMKKEDMKKSKHTLK